MLKADRAAVNAVIKSQASVIEKISVPNKIANDDSDISVDLAFESSKSFNPDKVAQQIPELQSMMAMRNLLKDLKSNLLDNTKFRKELEKIVKNQPELAHLQQQLEKIVPTDRNDSAKES